MKYRIRRTSQFKKDVKRAIKRGNDIEQLLSIVQELSEGRALAAQYQDHPMKGQWAKKRDCHIEPNWIMIYAIEGEELILYRTGSHSDLFL